MRSIPASFERASVDAIDRDSRCLPDANGREVKALRLIVNGNAVVRERLRSPIACRGLTACRDLPDRFGPDAPEAGTR